MLELHRLSLAISVVIRERPFDACQMISAQLLTNETLNEVHHTSHHILLVKEGSQDVAPVFGLPLIMGIGHYIKETLSFCPNRAYSVSEAAHVGAREHTYMESDDVESFADSMSSGILNVVSALHGPDHFHLVGLSLGGTWAIQVALSLARFKRGQCVGCIVLLDPFPPPPYISADEKLWSSWEFAFEFINGSFGLGIPPADVKLLVQKHGAGFPEGLRDALSLQPLLGEFDVATTLRCVHKYFRMLLRLSSMPALHTPWGGRVAVWTSTDRSFFRSFCGLDHQDLDVAAIRRYSSENETRVSITNLSHPHLSGSLLYGGESTKELREELAFVLA